MINFINFSTENHLLSFLLGSGLNLTFHWKAQLLIFIKSLFKSFAVEFILWITEKREVSSANNLGFKVKPSDKSLYSNMIDI